MNTLECLKMLKSKIDSAGMNNCNYVIETSDIKAINEAIDTVVAELEKPLPTDKDIENEQNTLIEFSEYLENENGIIIPIELINEYTERNNNESNIN